ncbi:MAG TPA: hypothetical protein PLA19_05475 [Candidatus Pacearchaeota archaeon]|nr:hypothetical protein [Candidatus Pacearchaeota archaeon]
MDFVKWLLDKGVFFEFDWLKKISTPKAELIKESLVKSHHYRGIKPNPSAKFIKRWQENLIMFLGEDRDKTWLADADLIESPELLAGMTIDHADLLSKMDEWIEADSNHRVVLEKYDAGYRAVFHWLDGQNNPRTIQGYDQNYHVALLVGLHLATLETSKIR